MSESYSQIDLSVERDESQDELFKRIGIVVAGAFTLVVLFFLGVILLRVDVPLLTQVLPQFVHPFLLVLFVVIVSGVLAVIFGVIMGFGRVSKTPFTYRIATTYVEFFRGTPLLFQLMVVYFGIPALWPPGQFPIQNWNIPAAIVGLTLNHAAYVGEAFRGGIAAVPDGQSEAARSLGMSYSQSMREIILPQAWRNALAAIGNDLIVLIKDTSLLTLIAVPELINQFRSVYSTNFDAWTPIVIIAVAYLVLTVPLGWLVRYLEDRSGWGGED